MRRVLGLAVVAGLLMGCGPEGTCIAPPVCEPGEVKSTPACASREPGCRTVTNCGMTIACRPGAADAGP